jgi:sugar lactone lactonase YvrE
VALSVWRPDKALRGACADFSDLEIGPDGRLYVLSDKSATVARLPDLPPTGGKLGAEAVWQLDDLEGKPEGLAFTPNGRALVALDTRKARHNLVLLEPPIAAV